MKEKILFRDVLSFIASFKGEHAEALEKSFTNGNCYWFAFILKERFGGRIKYFPIANHFACLIGGTLFDVTGRIRHQDEPFLDWERYKEEDPVHWERIYRNCVLLKDKGEKKDHE